ncbi:hypothetical protein ACJ73_03063 [Blastomyces percursus]|uniref:Uncharacterized protein n=1 Tax=Blastomyces percursus TaxID=1658174 RepID=A0A1J9Q9S3_9EURO|nr:hypothetical protein ACJ73_03063 [Blastomyces percursus]
MELLKVGTLRVAEKIVEMLGGLDISVTLEYLASGGYNHVWLLTYLPVSSASDLLLYIAHCSAPMRIRKLELRIPKESAQSLHPYQLRHEVACLQYLAQKVPEIPTPRARVHILKQVLTSIRTDHVKGIFAQIIDGLPWGAHTSVQPLCD